MTNEAKPSRKILTLSNILFGMLCLVGMVPGIIFYNQMPQQLPIHWNVHNQPDNFAPKQFVIFGLPLIMFVFHLICCIIENVKGTKTNPKQINTAVQLILPLITIILECVTIMYEMDMLTDIGLICCLIMAVIFIFMGNYLPKTQPNLTLGIKFPWTIRNEDVWHKTHRLAGWMMVFGGIIIIIAAFFKAYFLCVAIMLTAIFVPVIYSYVISKK